MTKRVLFIALAIQAILALAAWFAIPVDDELEYVWERSGENQELAELYENKLRKSPQDLESTARYARVLMELNQPKAFEEAMKVFQAEYRQELAEKTVNWLQRNQDFDRLEQLLHFLWTRYRKGWALKQQIDLLSWRQEKDRWAQALLELYASEPTFENLNLIYSSGQVNFALSQAESRISTAQDSDLIGFFDWGLAQGRPDISWKVFLHRPSIEFFGSSRYQSLKSLFHLFHDYTRLIELLKIQRKEDPAQVKSEDLATLLEYTGQLDEAFAIWEEAHESQKSEQALEHLINLGLLLGNDEKRLRYQAEMSLLVRDDEILRRVLFEYSMQGRSEETLSLLNAAMQAAQSEPSTQSTSEMFTVTEIMTLRLEELALLERRQSFEADMDKIPVSRLGPIALEYIAFSFPLEEKTLAPSLRYAVESGDLKLTSQILSWLAQKGRSSEVLPLFEKSYGPLNEERLNLFLSLFDGITAKKFFRDIFEKAQDQKTLEALANWALAQNDLNAASVVIGRLNRLFPNQTEWLEKEARTLFWQNRNEEARATLKKAIQAGSRDPRLRYEMGQQLLANGERTLALEHFRIVAEELIPQDEYEKNMLAWSLAQIGKRQESYAIYRDLIQNHPEKPEYINDFHSLLITLGENALLEAEEKKLDWTSQTSLPLMETWFYRYRSQGNNSKALLVLARAIAFLGERPFPYWVHVGEGWQAERTGYYQKAMQSYDRAMAIQQDGYLLEERERIRQKLASRVQVDYRNRNGVDAYTTEFSTPNQSGHFRFGVRLRHDTQRELASAFFSDQRGFGLSGEAGQDLGNLSFRSAPRAKDGLSFTLEVGRQPYWEYSEAVESEVDENRIGAALDWRTTSWGREFYLRTAVRRLEYRNRSGKVASFEGASVSVGRSLRRTGYLSLSVEDLNLKSFTPGTTGLFFSDYRAVTLGAEWQYQHKLWTLIPRLQLSHDMQELSWGGGLTARHRSGVELFWETSWDRFARDYTSSWGARYMREF